MSLSCHSEASVTSCDELSTHRKQSVILIAESLQPERGGAEIYLARLVQYLAKAGHPVRVYVRRPCSADLGEGIHLEVVPTVRRSRIVWERAFARRVANKIASAFPNKVSGQVAGGNLRERPIVLSTMPLPGITHYQPHSGLYRNNFEAIRESMDSVLRRTGHDIGNALNRRRHSLLKMQESLLFGDRPPEVMTFSNRFRDQLLEASPSLASRVTTAPLGVDLDCFYPAEPAAAKKRARGHLVLLFAGQNFRLKGLGSLLPAFREALRRGLDAELLVVGNTSGQNHAFPAMARSLGLHSQVRFLGSVTTAEMSRLYRSTDAFVHPTFSDHCSLVVLEALASGLPVITTRRNGASELMEHDREGFVLDSPNNIAALTAALLLLDNSAKLARMSAAAVELRPHLDFALHARQTLAWLTGDTTPAIGAAAATSPSSSSKTALNAASHLA